MATQKHRKPSNIRSEAERKAKVTSIRLTEEQHKTVQERAKSAGMTVSNYIITTAVNGGNALTPSIMGQIQTIANDACSIVNDMAPEKVQELQGKVNMLWQRLM